MSNEQLVSKPRRRNTKERIVDEAEALATLHGIEHLKLQDVADKIGIKLPSVYAHFSGREDILAAISSRINKGMASFYLASSEQSAVDCLHLGAQQMLSFLGDNPAYFRLMLRDYSVPLGYDPMNHRTAINQNCSLPQEIQALHNRIQSLLNKVPNFPGDFKAQDFSASVHGFVLLGLSWLPTQTNEQEVAFVDYSELKPKLRVLVSSLVGSN